MSDDSQSRENQALTHECNYQHLHPAAMDALADIVDRLRRGKVPGCFVAQDDWLEALNFPAPVPLLHDPAQAVADNKAADRLSAVLDPLNLVDIALSAIQDHIRFLKETCESRLTSLRIRGGLSSLPDDVFSIVLEHAYEGENGVMWVALKLSHVCHRFRQIALRIPTLWRNIWSRTDTNLISLLWDRITKPVAKITFHGVSSAADIISFIRCATARSEIWSEMFHILSANATLTRDVLGVMARETHQLHVPFLSFLYIERSRSRLTLQDPPLENSLHYYSTWSMPRLSKFIVENFIPIPLMNATSLTVFRIVLLLNHEQTEELSEIRAGERLSSLIIFLGSCPALQTVTMNIESFPDFIDFSTSEFADLPNVETLELSLIDCQDTVLKTFFINVRFPNVSTMELRFFASVSSISIQDDVDAVFWDSTNFDCLTRLTFTTLARNRNFPLRFPFSSLSRLQHLTFFGNMANYGSIYHEGPCLPELRSLTFENCHILDRDWAESLLARLQVQGNSPEVKEIWNTHR